MKYIALIAACLCLMLSLSGFAHAEIRSVWIPLLGTDALNVRSLRSDGERLYAGTRTGLYISDDDGFTWRPTEFNQPFRSDTPLTIHGRTVYAAAFPDGVFRSDDRGETWKPVNNGLPRTFWDDDDGESYYPRVKQIVVASSGTVILVSSTHLFTSTDRGDSWRDVTQDWKLSVDNKTPIAKLPPDSMTEFDGYLWAAGHRDAFRSADNGQTWDYIHSIGGAVWPFDWAVRGDRLYVAGDKGMARWNETAQRWQDLSAGFPPDITVLAPPEFYTLRIIIDRQDYLLTSFALHQGRFFAGLKEEGVYMFDDQTETWIGVGQPMDRVRVLETDGFRLYAAAGIRAESGLYISRDNGYTWNPTELNHSVNTIAIDQNTLYAGGDSHGVFRSDNLGDTWKPINNGIRTINVDNGEIRLPYIKQILVISSGTVVAVGYHSGTHISTDRGDTWDDVTLAWKVGQRVAPDWIIGDSIWSMTEFDGYLWAVYSSTSRSIFRSTDNGQTWEYTREQKYGQIADWSVLNGRLYAGTRNGLARWNEAQPAWEYFSEGLPVLSIGATASIKSLTVYRGRLFAGLYDHAGAEGGVYMFDDRIDTFVPRRSSGLFS